VGKSFVEMLRKGSSPVGTLVSVESPNVADVLAACGYDWLFVDLEHSALEIADAQRICQVVADRCAVILRVPTNDEVWIKRALDTGCDGVLVPQVNTADEARRAVRAAKYPPQGIRGVGVSRAHGFGLAFADYVSHANERTALLVQIEHIEAVENIDAILAVDGVDAVLVGPYDLSGSMDLLGQVQHEKVQAAIQRVLAACHAARVPAGIFALDPAVARAALKSGWSFVAAGLDLATLGQAARAAVALIRS
jgi:2-dehydro-3-deoxyglucarate aldolase/4-hydroxy-2-oxoheptanedioate aldolase